MATAFQFRFMALAVDIIDRRDPSNKCLASNSQKRLK